MASEAIADSLFSWLDAAGNTNTLDVDVVMSTEDTRTAQLSDHVVETGSVVTDHIVIRPESLSFELLVTQTPDRGADVAFASLPLEGLTATGLTSTTIPIKVRKSQFQPGGFLLLSTGLRTVVSGLLGVGDDTPSNFQGSKVQFGARTAQARTLQATTQVDRVNRAFDTLVEVMNTGLLVTVSFKGRLYLDYLLTKVTLSQGKGDAGCGRFKVEARAFRTVTGVNVQLPDPADFRALPVQKKGNQPAKTPDPDPTKKANSLLHRTGQAISPAVDKFLRAIGVGG
jgi:hypothetical protein